MASAVDTAQALLRIQVRRAGLPKRYSGGFDTFRELSPEYSDLKRRAVEWAESFNRNTDQQGLAIIGNVGTGKSHLAAGIALRVIERGFSVKWMNVAELFHRIRSSWDRNNDESEESIIDELVEPDLLVLDDLGVERPAGWILERLYTLINLRHDGCKPIVFTSNYSGKDLMEHMKSDGTDELAERIASRLAFMASSIGRFPTRDLRKSGLK